MSFTDAAVVDEADKVVVEFLSADPKDRPNEVRAMGSHLWIMGTKVS